jgi:hypothetical protein
MEQPTESLIFDRTTFDVDEALRNPNSSSWLKGAYNYIDLNRVESWCEYIQFLLVPYGFAGGLVFKTDWTIRDYPNRTQIDRIRNNVIAERDFLNLNNEILINNTLNYSQANALEKVFNDILNYIDQNFYTTASNDYIGAITAVNEYFVIKGKDLHDYFVVDYLVIKIGAIVAINEYYKIKGKNETKEIFTTNANNKIGSTTAVNEYFKLKAKED